MVVTVAFVGGRLGRASLWLAAVPMAATAVWSATRLGSGDVILTGFQWVPGLDVAIEFRVDAMSAALSVLVSGIGASVPVLDGTATSRRT